MGGTKEAALDLVERAYAAVSGESSWTDFLVALGQAPNAIVPGIFVLGVPGDVPILVRQERLEPSWQRTFESHYVTLDVRRPLIQRLPEGTVFRGQDVIPDRDYPAPLQVEATQTTVVRRPRRGGSRWQMFPEM